MTKQIQTLLGVCMLVVLVGGGCVAKAPTTDVSNSGTVEQESTSTVQETEPIRIGWLGPLTGDVAAIGKDARIAAELAVEEINAKGGINGRPIELVEEDAKCNSKDATAAGTKLITIDGIKLINGAACSPETLAVAPIAEQSKTVLLSYCSSAPNITDAGDYIFRSYPSDAYQGVYAAEYAYNDLGIRKAAMLAVLNDWGQGMKNTFNKRFLELGGEIVFVADHAQDATDFRTDLTKIKSTKAELIFFPSFTKSSIAGLRQIQELGITAKLLGGDAWDDTTIHESGVADDILYTAPKTDVSDEWRKKMEARGANVTVCAPRAYDNIYIYADVIGRVGTDSEKVKDELYKVKDFPGVAGPITLDQNGDVTTAEYNVKTVKNKKGEIVK